MNIKKSPSGFTLIELIVTLAIFALIMLFAAPLFLNQIQQERIRAAAENMYNYTLVAQELATSTGRIVGIAPAVGVTWVDQPLIMAYISETALNDANNATGSAGPIISADATAIIARETIFNTAQGQYTLSVARNSINAAGATDLFAHPTLDYIYFFPDGIVTSPNFLLVDNNNRLVSMVSNCAFNNGRNFYKIGFTHFAPNIALPSVAVSQNPTTNANCWITSN